MIFKLMFVSIAGFLSIGAMAQAKTSIGLTGGINWNNINGKTASGSELNNQLKTGFNGGVNVEIPVGTGFYLQPGIEYRQKGSELSNGDKLSIGYVEVPVNLVYKPVLGTGSVLLGFGPYIGMGIHGTMDYTDKTAKDVIFTNIYSATEATDYQFKKIDAGANFMAGYEFRNKLSASVKAQLGLIDINPESNIEGDHTRYRNTGFGLSMGYRF